MEFSEGNDISVHALCTSLKTQKFEKHKSIEQETGEGKPATPGLAYMSIFLTQQRRCVTWGKSFKLSSDYSRKQIVTGASHNGFRIRVK